MFHFKDDEPEIRGVESTNATYVSNIETGN